MALEDAYELAYREAVRALDHQRAALTELQGRAGMLLATASIALSLLSRAAAGGLRPLGWLTILCFALLGLCVLAVVWPYETGSFDVDPQALLAVHLTTEVPDMIAFRTQLIAHTAAHHRANQRQLARRSTAFRIGACLLAIQMLLTLAAATVIV